MNYNNILYNPNRPLFQIKVMLRVCPTEGSTGSSSTSFLKVDDRRRQVTVYDPSAGVTSLRRPMPPKMFAFDGICDQDDSMVGVQLLTRFSNLVIRLGISVGGWAGVKL